MKSNADQPFSLSEADAITDFIDAYPTPKDVYSQTVIVDDYADTCFKDKPAAKLHYLELMDNFVKEG